MTTFSSLGTARGLLVRLTGVASAPVARLAALAVTSTVTIIAVAGLAGLSACGSLNDVAAPSNLVDTSQVQSRASALAMYNAAIFNFSRAFAGGTGSVDGSYAGQSGLFADEYTTTVGGGPATVETHTATVLTENGGMYSALQGARRTMDAAIGHLVANGGTLPQSYIGEMHALKGYVYLLLSELYCEGVPFSQLNTTGLVQYGEPETLVDMNNHAIAQFDSAVTYATDSTRILQLAAVGKGRAYLNMAEFDSAKAAVASVPTSFVYATTYAATTYVNYISGMTSGPYQFMSDHEGGNGLDYASSPDTRLAKTIISGQPFPAKFPAGATPIPLASGVEARLIEAEAALHDNDIPTWTTTLNTLRASGGTTVVPALTADSTTTAADTLRVNVMFRERAFWMFGTGHRQGDMRRLIRQYGRLPEKVYSVGVWSRGTVSIAYIPSPVLYVPEAEIDNNPKYHGCLNVGA